MAKSPKEQDVGQLIALAKKIDKKKQELDALYAQRRLIWKRRIDSGDASHRELAQASSVFPMAIRQGIRDDLIEQAEELLNG